MEVFALCIEETVLEILLCEKQVDPFEEFGDRLGVMEPNCFPCSVFLGNCTVLIGSSVRDCS